jgi:WhiB family transcriptional regulator, redox-sensing transcriptional regulator
VSWRERAACADYPTSMFFVSAPSAIARAKRICESCEVRLDCLEDCLRVSANDDRHGVFGGCTPSERRRLRAQLAEAGIKPTREETA